MRFPNPHPMHNQMQMQQNQQYVTQPMQNPQQMQTSIVMTPQGPMMQTPQGYIPVMQTPQGFIPVQQGMINQMPMNQGQYPNQPMFPQQQPQLANTGRFTGGAQSAQQPFTNDNNVQPGRFTSPSVQQEQVIEEETITIPIPFTVKPIQQKRGINQNVKLTVMTTEVKSNNICKFEGVASSDCFSEVIESLIEDTYAQENNKLISCRNFVVSNLFYKVDMNDFINELYSGDIKSFYKLIKTTYKDAKDKYEVNLLDTIDTIFTDKVNDYIATTTGENIFIDSFINDFNDLLKVLRNFETEFLEDNLLEYMNKYIKNTYEYCAKIKDEENSKVCVVPEPYVISYLDKHTLEIGLESLSNRFIRLEDTPPNVFLNSLAMSVCEAMEIREFILVTMNKSIFKVIVDDESNVFIKAVV